jgi:hypothetical protein
LRMVRRGMRGTRGSRHRCTSSRQGVIEVMKISAISKTHDIDTSHSEGLGPMCLAHTPSPLGLPQAGGPFHFEVQLSQAPRRRVPSAPVLAHGSVAPEGCGILHGTASEPQGEFHEPYWGPRRRSAQGKNDGSEQMMDFKLYLINRKLDSLCLRADRLGQGASWDSLIRRIERLNIEHHLRLAELAAVGGLEQV